jgi:mannose-1-phosphate guanylyltransferase
MIRQTFLRLRGFVPASSIWIISGEDHVARIRRQIPEIRASHVIGEPAARNTAPCVALAAFLLRQEDPETLMFVLPADHVIDDRREFHRSLTAAAHVAVKHDALVTFGIKPTVASTGYGYLELEKSTLQTGGISYYKLRRFVEKPNRAKARLYLRRGNFLWNSGMFVWKTSAFLKNLRRYMPENFRALERVDWSRPQIARQQLFRIYPRLDATSVDYGIMEKAENIYAVRATFDWSDVGSWDAVEPFLRRDGKGNVSRGKLIALDSRGLIVDSPKLVATVGVRDLIIIDSGDALLVCDKTQAQKVKQVVDRLKSEKLSRYL